MTAGALPSRGGFRGAFVLCPLVKCPPSRGSPFAAAFRQRLYPSILGRRTPFLVHHGNVQARFSICPQKRLAGLPDVDQSTAANFEGIRTAPDAVDRLDKYTRPSFKGKHTKRQDTQTHTLGREQDGGLADREEAIGRRKG